MGPSIPFPSSWGTRSYTWGTNPRTGNNWTVDDVNAAQFGLYSYGSYGGGRLAQIYVDVSYS